MESFEKVSLTQPPCLPNHVLSVVGVFLEGFRELGVRRGPTHHVGELAGQRVRAVDDVHVRVQVDLVAEVSARLLGSPHGDVGAADDLDEALEAAALGPEVPTVLLELGQRRRALGQLNALAPGAVAQLAGGAFVQRGELAEGAGRQCGQQQHRHRLPRQHGEAAAAAAADDATRPPRSPAGHYRPRVAALIDE